MWFLRLDVHTTRLGSCFAFSVESRASTDVPLEWSPVLVFCLSVLSFFGMVLCLLIDVPR